MSTPVAPARLAAWAGSLVRTRSRGDAILRAAAHPAVIATAVAAIVLVRLGSWLARPAFLEEELVGWVGGGDLLAPWHTFLYPVIRVVFLATSSPAVAVLAMTTGVALVAGFVASDRLADAIPDRPIRLAAAVGIALLPFGEARIYSTAINLHWFLTIYLAALLLATKPFGRFDRLAALVCAISSPASIFLAPLYLWRRPDRWLVAAVCAGAAAQAIAFALAPRAAGGADPLSVALVSLARLGVAPIGDRSWLLVDYPPLGLALAGVALAAAAMLRDLLPRLTLIVLGVTAALVILAGIATSDLTRLAAPDEAVRYFVLGTWVLLLLALAGIRAHRPAGFVLGTLFAFGIVSTFVLTPHPPV
jgi:hypothetical protein